jgi:signal transduction histidine kinase
MSIEMRLHELAEHVQALLCCDGVGILLGCSEPDLCHPLLRRLARNGTTPYIASIYSAMPPLHHERVAALCDIACQTGTMWEIASIQLSDNSPGKLIVLPLEALDGVLGLLLFSYKAPKDFSVDDFLCLQQNLPIMLHYLEKLLMQDWPECSNGQEIARANKQQELVAIVSHELRVPLAAIKGYIVLLQTYGYEDTAGEMSAEAMSAEQRRRYLSAVMEQINYLEVLVNDLLDVSQLQAGHLALQPTQVDMEALCQSVMEQMRKQVEQQQPDCYTFRYQVEDELPLVWADPVRVRQVLINLLENAVKYSPSGGPIEIVLHTEQALDCDMNLLQVQHTTWLSLSERKVCISIRDEGIGISQQQQAALFKPFMRLENLATSAVPGNGLGLYIARRLVEAMNGHLHLSSNEGQGTCVTFTLPVVATLSYSIKQPLG